MSDMLPTLLLVDPGPPRKRALLELFLKQPVRLFVVVDPDDTWVRTLVPADHLICADVSDTERLAAMVETFRSSGGIVFDGVGTYHERAVVAAALLAQAHGVPGPSIASIARTSHDKIAMRQTLRDAGVATPSFAVVNDLQDLAAAVARIGLPCVVKPVSGADSDSVRKLTCADDIAAAQRSGRAIGSRGRGGNLRPFDGRWLVEAYLDGPLVSVDGIVERSNVRMIGMTEMELGPEPWFNIEVNWMPPRLESGQCAACEELAESVVEALKLDCCGFHAEMRMTHEGPVLVEIAGRIAGGHMPEGYRRSLGIDLTEILTRLWLGQPVIIEPQRRRHVLQKGVFARSEGVLTHLFGAAEAAALPGVTDFQVVTRHGSPVLVYPRASQPLYYYAIEAEDANSLADLAKRVETMVSWTVS
jgi:cysteine synthase A